MRSNGPLAAAAVAPLIVTLAGCTGASDDAHDAASAGWTTLE